MAIAVDESHPETNDRLEEPFYFPSDGRQMFGWLHRPASEPADIGLVICKPFGYEAICSHRSVRALAQTAAAVGIPALRFDYTGTGDSEDAQPGTEQFAIWTQDVVAAVHEMQRRTGVARVCLLGIRLGALLAMRAAAQCEAACALIVIAPVINGRRYLRELRTVQLAAAQLVVAAPTPIAETEETKAADTGSLEVSGFSLSPQTIATLMSTDLMTQPAPAMQILVIDRTDLPGARAWATALSGLGASVEYQCLPGIVEMVWTAPHFSVIPKSIFGAIKDWLMRLPAVATADNLPSRGQRYGRFPDPASTTLRLRFDADGTQTVLTEHPVFVCPERGLFGIVTEPPSGEARRRGVILLNGGATYHIGPNRLYVSLARRWAQHGYVVLRLDLAGLGESAPAPGRPGSEVFPPSAIEDIRSAIEHLRDQYAVRDITVGGLCSGAYHSLRAAVSGLPVSRVLMVNPQNFFWKEGMAISDLQLAEIVHNPGVYRERLLSGAYWRRLLTGRVNIWRVVKIYVHRVWFAVKTSLRDLARYLHIHLSRDLGRELAEVAARGVRIVFAFSRGDVGIDLLRLQGGSSLKRLGDSCRIHIVDGADHIFSQGSARRALEGILSDELFAPSPVSMPSPDQKPAAPVGGPRSRTSASVAHIP